MPLFCIVADVLYSSGTIETKYTFSALLPLKEILKQHISSLNKSNNTP